MTIRGLNYCLLRQSIKMLKHQMSRYFYKGATFGTSAILLTLGYIFKAKERGKFTKKPTPIPEASETVHDTFCGVQSSYSGWNV